MFILASNLKKFKLKKKKRTVKKKKKSSPNVIWLTYIFFTLLLIQSIYYLSEVLRSVLGRHNPLLIYTYKLIRFRNSFL